MMNHKIPDLYSEAILADIIETCAEGTYVGKYDRAKYDPSIDVHAQPIWRIRFFENTVNENTAAESIISDTDMAEEMPDYYTPKRVNQAIYPDFISRTRILYPDGRPNFTFVWDNRKNYTYKYAL